MADPLPRADNAFNSFSRIFVHVVSEHAAELGIEPALVAELVERQAHFAERLAATKSPMTAGPRATLLKNEARQALEKPLRTAAGIIRANPQVSPERLQGLGLLTPAQMYGRRRHVAPPAEGPRIHVRLLDSGRLRVLLISPGTERRRKPDGAASAIIFTHITGDRLRGEDVWQLARVTTRPICRVRMPRGLQPGDELWLRACWVSPTGKMSPMGDARRVRLWMGPGLVEPKAKTNDEPAPQRLAA